MQLQEPHDLLVRRVGILFHVLLIQYHGTKGDLWSNYRSSNKALVVDVRVSNTALQNRKKIDF